jgi:hypothetical protein
LGLGNNIGMGIWGGMLLNNPHNDMSKALEGIEMGEKKEKLKGNLAFETLCLAETKRRTCFLVVSCIGLEECFRVPCFHHPAMPHAQNVKSQRI